MLRPQVAYEFDPRTMEVMEISFLLTVGTISSTASGERVLIICPGRQFCLAAVIQPFRKHWQAEENPISHQDRVRIFL